MKLLACLNSTFALFATIVHANVEKIIFLAPSSQTGPNLISTWDHSGSLTLTPTKSTLRKSLPVVFTSADSPYGVESWYVLQQLNPGHRYEARICWAASQPTDFHLDVFDISEITGEPDLFHSFTASNQPKDETLEVGSSRAAEQSILGLRIRAAADFYTVNQTLMQHPPSVDVEIILDPYLGNIFPASLLPTAAYISILAIIGWYVSGLLWSFLTSTEVAGKVHVE